MSPACLKPLHTQTAFMAAQYVPGWCQPPFPAWALSGRPPFTSLIDCHLHDITGHIPRRAMLNCKLRETGVSWHRGTPFGSILPVLSYPFCGAVPDFIIM